MSIHYILYLFMPYRTLQRIEPLARTNQRHLRIGIQRVLLNQREMTVGTAVLRGPDGVGRSVRQSQTDACLVSSGAIKRCGGQIM